MKTISIPQGVTSIGVGAFHYCSGLTSISIPQGVSSIGFGAFQYCYALTSISIPQEVSIIGGGAFYACTNLKSINIPQGVTSIGSVAFYYCTGLTNIRFNSATTTIYDGPYTIPEQAKIIGYDPSTAKNYATKYNRQFEAIGTTYGKLQFSSAAYNISEAGPTATITVSRVNGSAGTVGVSYATGNGTAIAGADYTAKTGTLSFAAGEVSKTFTVPIINDTALESNETVKLTLSSPTGGATLGTPSLAILTILDNDTSQ